MADVYFALACGLNGIAASLHLWVIVEGADGYRRFGAGEKMARMAEQGRIYPHVITFFIAGALFFFAYLCLSQIGTVPAPPLAREVLWALTAVYLVRGLVPLLAYRWLTLYQTRFFVISSVIVLGFGGVHLAALIG